MRKIFNSARTALAVTFFAVFALAGCSRETLTSDVKDAEGYVSMSFTANAEQVKTSLVPGEGNQRFVHWNNGDQITIYWDGGSNTAVSSSSGASTCFNTKVAGDATDFLAVYPGDLAVETDFDRKEAVITVQDIQNGGEFAKAAYSVAVTTSREKTLEFHNAVSLICFTVASDTVKTVRFQSIDSSPIAGKVLYNSGDGTFKTLEGSTSYEVTVNINGAGTYYAAILPDVTLDKGLAVWMTAEHTELPVVYSSEKMTVERGHIANIGTIDTKAVTDYFFTPTGTGKGRSWEDAAGVEMLRELLFNEGDAISVSRLKGHNLYLAAGTYILPQADEVPVIKFESNTPFNVYGGFSASSTGTDKSRLAENGDSTIFTGNGGKIMDIKGKITASFHRIKFCNARYSGDDGAALSVNYSSVSFTGCIFADNTSEGGKSGGAFKVSNAGLSFTDCLFYGNSSKNGSSMYINNPEAEVHITRCTFRRETSENTGIISLANGKALTIADSEFSNGTSGGHGAAINVAAGTVSISGTTFSGLKSSNGYGGAIYVDKTADVTLGTCTFSNTSAKRGGAIYGNNGLLTATGCTFDGTNVTEQGGMAFIVNNFELTLKGCDINSVWSQGNGGAIGTNSQYVKLTIMKDGEKGTTISGTYSKEGQSGAIHVWGGTVNISNTVFKDCSLKTSDKTASIMRLGNVANCTFENCEFKNCFNPSTTGNTGGIAVDEATASFSSCLWEGNSARRGACIATTNANSKVICNSCTFKDNTATQYGAAVAILSAANPQLDFNGCTFKGNKSNTYAAIIFLDYPATHVHFSACEFLENSCVNEGVIAYDYKRTSSNYLLTFDGCYFKDNTWDKNGMFTTSYEKDYRKNVIFLNDCQFYNNHTTGTAWPWGHVTKVTGVCANNVTIYCDNEYPLQAAFASTDVGCLVVNSTMVSTNAYAKDNHGIIFADGATAKVSLANNLAYFDNEAHATQYVYIQNDATAASFGHSLYANGSGHLTPAVSDKLVTWDYLGTAGYDVAKRAFIWGGPDDSFTPAGKQDILDAINAFNVTSKLPTEKNIGSEFLSWLDSLPSKPLDSRSFAWPGAYEPVK